MDPIQHIFNSYTDPYQIVNALIHDEHVAEEDRFALMEFVLKHNPGLGWVRHYCACGKEYWNLGLHMADCLRATELMAGD